ncbi:hypothetical protein PC129_g24397 [Phytophthora cactorum]|uniref:LicD family n=1 Tax=Phytophthora cactorum TaxID=29920 RepID=A0A329RA44_9STRA|nr:hypothetical protein Pcac1_g13778 [Phytophthora cactorum]KAG2782666.1 hypothetical protein PC111_g24484 [Phytophthora cactorum]KAG2786546.1 hypothetical protein PC112_g24603 [Phytophthora cactorum]KAG2802992.1 hypothetical protein PC113_g24438 [Phytophthora cactorum]KAG2870218.1 hypothetical protein PC114_g27484 [Phytophthora cactorum]
MENSGIKKLEESVDVIKHAPPRPIGIMGRFLLGCRDFWTGVTVIPTFILVLMGLLMFGFIMETHIMSCVPEVAVLNDTKVAKVCTPRVLNASTIEYHSGHRFYSELKEMDPRPAPTFRGNHTVLCHEEIRTQAKYGYCLPISGRKDVPFCTAADRMDLLHTRSSKSLCYASVLHMLMVEVYEELQATGNTPLITFGSLLGAVRNGSMIPFTEDTDIAFVNELKAREALQEALWRKGYHMFFLGIWRVCVAPTHPLAGRLYDSNLPLTKRYSVPYVDLYQMKKTNQGVWDIEELVGSNGRFLPTDRVEPFSQVTINGMPFDTVQDPHFFLKEAYGPDYMTPKPRKT